MKQKREEKQTTKQSTNQHILHMRFLTNLQSVCLRKLKNMPRMHLSWRNIASNCTILIMTNNNKILCLKTNIKVNAKQLRKNIVKIITITKRQRFCLKSASI